MAEDPSTPHSPSKDRPASFKSNRSLRSDRSRRSQASEETTPLLARQETGQRSSGSQLENGDPESPTARSLRSIQSGGEEKANWRMRWPSILAFSVLSLIIVAILCFGFAAPTIVEEYAQQAAVVELTDLSLDSFTAAGVRVRVHGTFMLDSSRVHSKAIADIGRAATWIAKEVETQETDVNVYLPQRDNAFIGVAVIPPLKVNIRNRNLNTLSFLAYLEPRDIGQIRRLANDYLDNSLGSFWVEGFASATLKSGIFNLGTQKISHSVLLEGQDLPALPNPDVKTLMFEEAGTPSKPEGIMALATLSIRNGYPVKLDIPPLRFDVLVPNCLDSEEPLLLGEADTGATHVSPEHIVDVKVTGVVQRLSKNLTTVCPTLAASPLDAILVKYLKGNDTTVYVRGGARQARETPAWLTEIMREITVPIPIPSHPSEDLVHDFSLSNVHFSFPNPLARPNSPQAQPKISATIEALVALPKDMNFNIAVDRVRADADVFYKGSKMGELDLHKWQKARTSKVEDGGKAGLLLHSQVDEAPLNVTNDDVFTDLMRSLVFGDDGVALSVKARVDVNSKTALGEFVIRGLPAHGQVYIKGISEGKFKGLSPQIGSLQILDTTESSLKVAARINITNPTDYAAQIPYININILHNDTILGNAIAKDLHLVPGINENLNITALWKPSGSGSQGSEIGRNLISQYISGFNTTLTLKTHEGTIPSQPALGKALSKFEIVVDTPKLSLPGTPGEGDGDDRDGDDGEPHFIRETTMYLLSSTAAFRLVSPLPSSTFYITSIHATAFYNHTIPVGSIDNELVVAVPPGESVTPAMDIDWDVGGAGYAAIRDALYGTLKLDARANATIRLDRWKERLWFIGHGIGASIRL